MSKTPILAAAAIAAALALAPIGALATDAKPTAKPAAAQDAEKDERHEPAEGTQQHKMKVCNAEAHERGLRGDERRAFMSSCLRK